MRLVRLQWGLALLLTIGLLGFAPRAHATASGVISQSVAVCDPKFPNNCSQGGPFVPDAISTTTLSLTTVSASVALPGKGQTVIVLNTGTTDAYVKLGTSAVTSTTTDFFVKAGAGAVLARQTNTYLSGITGADTSTLVVMTGNGAASAVSAGGGGGGGTVTVTNPFDLEATQLLIKADLDALAAALSSAIPTGANTIGNVGLVAGAAKVGQFAVDQTTPGTTNAVQPIAGTTGGATPYGLQSAASTNSTNVKASAGVLYGMNLLNTTTTVYYLRMYDSASAPTCSSATNFTRSWPIPPAASAGLVGGVAVSLPSTGTQFSAGISFCLTGGGSSTDNTNAATGIFVNLDYK